jgi:hypothetical protein
MISNYPCLEFIRIAKECRNTLIEDTLGSNSPDLYGALYRNSKSQIHQIMLELYEIKWIEQHWEKISETIENRACAPTERKELISMFAKWYRDFVSNWNYTEFDAIIFEKRINILKSLISVNSEWERNLKRMKVSFEQSKKVLSEKIKTLEMEEN